MKWGEQYENENCRAVSGLLHDSSLDRLRAIRTAGKHAKSRPGCTVERGTYRTDYNGAEASGADAKILIAYFAVAENSDVDAISSASVISGTSAHGRQYDPLADRAKEQQNNDELPVLTSRIENLDDYD